MKATAGIFIAISAFTFAHRRPPASGQSGWPEIIVDRATPEIHAKLDAGLTRGFFLSLRQPKAG